ncbi:MAG: gliding motility-associated C-terminal domain-containing protein [Saprospiraceae bacterium]|nr:gliding motility-associated C-terminal domain-containing protein [Saprospiraceae bacterium]
MRTVIRTIIYLMVIVLAGINGVQAGIDNRRDVWNDSNLAFTPVSDQDTTDCQESYVVEYEYDFVPVLKCQYLHTGIVTYSLPLFADIDGDGETEVVVTLEHLPDGFAVVNPNNCEVEHLVNVQGNVSIKDGGTVLGDVDQDGFVDIFIEANSRIQRWEYQAETGEMQMIWQTGPNVSVADRSHMDIIDLNQDGQAELIPNQGHMVNAVTGYVYPDELPLLDTQAKGLFAYTADADPGQAPEGQGNVELIYGTHLYRYDFINEEWIVVREQSAVDWGYFANVSIADMDLDGDVDAVISHWDAIGQAVIWDLQTDELLGGGVFDYPGTYGSRINISNMDEDEYPEMVMTCVYKVFAMDDIVTSGGFNKVIWLDETSDESGHTQLTSFDFDGNGTYEIIYRDETRMRIFSGLGSGEPTNGYPSGPLILLDSGDLELCESYTGMEYPTIGDIDNDNQAEIVATCRGALNIYESGSLPWGNASKVWNTQAFNVSCVNQDGTIPAVMTENYTLYNNFLAQVNTNPESDTLVITSPDAIIQLNELEVNCDGAVALSIEICNQGANFLPEKIPVALYWSNPTTEASTLIDTIHISNRLEEGECIEINTSFYSVPENEGSIFAVVNDDGQQELPYLMDAVDNGGLFPVTNIRECDYTNNLTDTTFQLAWHVEVNLNYEICDGQTLEIDGQSYDEAGSYTYIIPTAQGCDSTINLNLEFLPQQTSFTESAICEGETYLFNGMEYVEAGEYHFTTMASTGCDSTITLSLNVLEHFTTVLNAEICVGETYTFANQELDQSGSFEQVLVASNGCDSIVTLTLNILDNSSSTQAVQICAGESLQLLGETFDESGEYHIILPNEAGCDSTIFLSLEVLQPSMTQLEVDLCEGGTYELNGEIFTEAGQYIQKISGSNGCDSIIYLSLSTIPSLYIDLEEKICRGDTLVFGNQYLTEPGDYSHLFVSSEACDSTVLLKLTVIEPVWGETSAEICEGETYEWNGQVYTEKGIYQDTLNALNSCDSIVQLVLDVHPIQETQILEKICEGTSYEMNGQTFDDEGVYEIYLQSINGCDSIIYLELVLLDNIQEEITVYICDGENYEFAGLSYEQAGIYSATFTSATGCDSMVQLNLDVLPHYELEETIQICEGETITLGNQQVSTAGTYILNFQTIAACDSTIIYQVEVLPNIELFGADVSICKGESIELEVFGSDEVNWSPAIGLDCTSCTNPLASPEETITYTIQAVTCGGALVETSLTVEVLEQPTIDAGTGQTITPGQSVDLAATGEWGDGQVQWDGPQGIICQDCPRVSVSPASSSIYQASVSNQYGCLASDTIHIQLRLDCIKGDFFIPNTFSPNGDGTNEEFYITAYTSANLEYLRIYDRWGELMFETNDFNQRWDGTFRGKKLNPGVYVYYMRVKCPDEESYERFGNVTLIR